jgi:hypothetical protein
MQSPQMVSASFRDSTGGFHARFERILHAFGSCRSIILSGIASPEDIDAGRPAENALAADGRRGFVRFARQSGPPAGILSRTALPYFNTFQTVLM